MAIMSPLMARSFFDPLVHAFGLTSNNYVSNVCLCIGPPPTDIQVDSVVSTSRTTVIAMPFIANAIAVSISHNLVTTSVNWLQLDNRTYAMNNIVLSGLSANATKAGVISWGIMFSSWSCMFVDVGLANSGAVIQVDTVNVAVGTPVTILDVSAVIGV